MTIDERLDQLERTVRRQRLWLGIAGLGGIAALSMAFAPAAPGTIEAQAIRIVDAAGKPRILIGASLELVAIPIFGALSDRVGRRPVYLFGAVMTAVLAFPLFSPSAISRTAEITAPTQ